MTQTTVGIISKWHKGLSCTYKLIPPVGFEGICERQWLAAGSSVMPKNGKNPHSTRYRVVILSREVAGEAGDGVVRRDGMNYGKSIKLSLSL